MVVETENNLVSKHLNDLLCTLFFNKEPDAISKLSINFLLIFFCVCYIHILNFK